MTRKVQVNQIRGWEQQFHQRTEAEWATYRRGREARRKRRRRRWGREGRRWGAKRPRRVLTLRNLLTQSTPPPSLPAPLSLPPLPPPPLEAENTIAHSRQWHLPDCRCADSSENKESETNPQHRSIPIEASRSERRTRRRRGAAGSRCCLSGLPDTARAGLDTPCIYVSVGHFFLSFSGASRSKISTQYHLIALLMLRT